MSTLRRYRLFVTLLIVPVVVIALIVVLIINLVGGEEEPTPAADTTPTAAVGIEPIVPPAVTPPIAVPTIDVEPTQTPVPEPTRSPTPVPEPTTTPEPTPTPPPTGPIPYEVQAEDTLFTIAAQFDVSVEDILEFNGLEDPDFIFVGQILEIPTDPAQIAERRVERPAPISAVVIPVEGLNVRDAPSVTESTVQYVAPDGSQIELTGRTEAIDGVIWYEIEDGNWAQGQGPDFEYLEIGATAAEPAPEPEATAEPTPEPEASPVPTETPTETPGDGAVTAIVVPENGLNVRVAPASDANVAYVAPGGSELELTGETTVIGGVTWWKIVDGNWVQGQFLKFG